MARMNTNSVRSGETSPTVSPPPKSGPGGNGLDVSRCALPRSVDDRLYTPPRDPVALFTEQRRRRLVAHVHGEMSVLGGRLGTLSSLNPVPSGLTVAGRSPASEKVAVTSRWPLGDSRGTTAPSTGRVRDLDVPPSPGTRATAGGPSSGSME